MKIIILLIFILLINYISTYESYTTRCEYLADKMNRLEAKVDRYEESYVRSFEHEKQRHYEQMMEAKVLFKEIEEQYVQHCVDHNTKVISRF